MSSINWHPETKHPATCLIHKLPCMAECCMWNRDVECSDHYVTCTCRAGDPSCNLSNYRADDNFLPSALYTFPMTLNTFCSLQRLAQASMWPRADLPSPHDKLFFDTDHKTKHPFTVVEILLPYFALMSNRLSNS